MTKPKITQEEFHERVLLTQEEMRKENIDVLLCFASEAEPQFVRYYSNYWPSFEFAGVLILQHGDPMLIIGPESMTYATHTSVIPKIRKLLAFRESSNPEYPGVELDTFETIIKNDTSLKSVKKVGISGFGLITHQIYKDFVDSMEALGASEIINADYVVEKLRVKKTPGELACMREAYRITGIAMNAVIDNIKVGMSENQVKGIAMSTIFSEGAEAEGYPFWILTGKDSNQAISRVRGKIIEDGDLVQIQVSARYEGYVATIGRPIVMGKASAQIRQLVEGCYETQKQMLDYIKPGAPAKGVSEVHYSTLKKLGLEDHILYGPSHGTGLMEGEYPWIESNSNFDLSENTTFCTCLYLGNDEKKIGIRVEDGFVITKDGAELLSNVRGGVIEIID